MTDAALTVPSFVGPGARRTGTQPGATAAGDSSAAWGSWAIVLTPIVGATLLAKLGFPPLAAAGIGVLFPMMLLAVAWGVAGGYLQIDSRRCVSFLLTIALLGLLQIACADSFSMASFLMLLATSLPFAFTARSAAVGMAGTLRVFCTLTAVIAGLGVVQFFIQFLGNTALTFPIEALVPDAFLTKGYNSIPSLYYGSPLYRSMGFVMLEPSFFCQLCALGFLAELSTRSRNLRLALYAVAMAVSYSGTGLLMLAVALPVLIVTQRRWDLLLRGVLILGVLLLLAEPLNLSVILDRAGEISSSRSSAFARFVGWQDLFADRLWPSPMATLFGHGAGSFERLGAGYAAAQMAHAKIIFELGVLGGLLYFGCIFFCIFSNAAPRVLQLAIAVCYFMNGAYAPLFTGVVLSVLLWPYSPGRTDPPAISARGNG